MQTDSFWKIAGNGGVEEAKRPQEHYCSMVASGHWPGYTGNYKEPCHQPQK